MQALIGPTPVLDVKKASKPGLTDVLKLWFEAFLYQPEVIQVDGLCKGLVAAASTATAAARTAAARTAAAVGATEPAVATAAGTVATTTVATTA